MCKRPLPDPGASVKKRPKTSSRTVTDNDSEIIESEESEALPENYAGETKESDVDRRGRLKKERKQKKIEDAEERKRQGAGVNRSWLRQAKPKRPRGTKFINFTCELDTDNCVHDENGLCIAHNTSNGNTKVGYLVNAVDAQLTCGSKEKVKFNCDVCFHVFPIRLKNVTEGQWCGMCSHRWVHCGVDTCTFCFERSIASYEGLTLNDKKKADCTVKKADLRLPSGSAKKVKFKCDVCLHVFSMTLNHVINGHWCSTCKNKTELMVLNFLQDEMNIKVVTQYIPGGMKQMKKNYGKFGKLDYHLPNSDFIWELDGAQHNLEVTRFGDTTLFHRMILDKWKEYLVGP